MNKLSLIIGALAVLMIIPVFVIAGNYHGYHGGHGYGIKSWNMEDLDTDNDGYLSYEEFEAPSKKMWQSGFDSVDEDKDGFISELEWKAVKEMHGVTTE